MFLRKLILLTSIVSEINCETCWSQFVNSPSCDFGYGTELYESSYTRNALQCASSCSQTPACVSVLYNVTTRMCRMNAEKLLNLTTGCSHPASYAETQQSSCEKLTTTTPMTTTTTVTTTTPMTTTTTTVTTTTLGQSPYLSMNLECMVIEECSTIMYSECRGGICRCLAGYSYDVVNSICVTSCPNGYGATFQFDERKVINGYNNKVVTVANLDECLVACNEETTFVCITVEFKSTTNGCYLSVETALTQPSVYADDTLNAYHLYHRDCGL